MGIMGNRAVVRAACLLVIATTSGLALGDDQAGSEFTDVKQGEAKSYPPQAKVPLPCENSLATFFGKDTTLEPGMAPPAQAGAPASSSKLYRLNAQACSMLFGSCNVNDPHLGYQAYANQKCQKGAIEDQAKCVQEANASTGQCTKDKSTCDAACAPGAGKPACLSDCATKLTACVATATKACETAASAKTGTPSVPGSCSQQKDPDTSTQTLSQVRGSAACAEALDSCKTACDPDGVSGPKTAEQGCLDKCGTTDEACKKTVSESPDYLVKQKFGIRSYLNEMLIRQVVGVHLDLLYRYGVNASNLPKEDGGQTTTDPTAPGAPPSLGTTPSTGASGTPSRGAPKFDPRLMLSQDVFTEENPGAGACNLVCGEEDLARGVWDTSSRPAGSGARFPAPCGKTYTDWTVSEDTGGVEACYDTDSGNWFDEGQPLMGSSAVGAIMNKVDSDVDEDGDDDCNGVMRPSFKREFAVASWERGAFAQLTWVKLDQVLNQLLQASTSTSSPYFTVPEQCQTIAGSYLGQLKDAMAALDSQGVCGLSLENLKCDPKNPGASATNQRDCYVRALTTALQGANFVQVLECSIYAEVANAWQAAMERDDLALKSLRNRAIWACNQYWQGGTENETGASPFPDSEITYTGTGSKCDLDEDDNGPPCYLSDDNHKEDDFGTSTYSGLGTPSCFRKVYAGYYREYMVSASGLGAGPTSLQQGGFPTHAFPGTSGILDRKDVFSPGSSGPDGSPANLVLYSGALNVEKPIKYGIPTDYSGPKDIRNGGFGKACMLKDNSPQALPSGPGGS